MFLMQAKRGLQPCDILPKTADFVDDDAKDVKKISGEGKGEEVFPSPFGKE